MVRPRQEKLYGFQPIKLSFDGRSYRGFFISTVLIPIDQVRRDVYKDTERYDHHRQRGSVQAPDRAGVEISHQSRCEKRKNTKESIIDAKTRRHKKYQSILKSNWRVMCRLRSACVFVATNLVCVPDKNRYNEIPRVK